MAIEIGIGVLLFLVGYAIGRADLTHKLFRQNTPYLGKPQDSKGWLSSNSKDKPSRVIDIDESKFVTDVSTDSFTSKHKGLGEKTVSQDSGIGASVSKLKGLKERKQ